MHTAMAKGTHSQNGELADEAGTKIGRRRSARNLHLHVSPMNAIADLDFARVDPDPSPESLDDAAIRIRVALGELGYDEVSD